jgi:biopolymer transport protein ExbD
MGGFDTGGDDDVITHINVTPLVDIVLVLLIVFMVTTPYIVRSQVDVDLPEAASGDAGTEETLTIQISSDGTHHLDGEEATLEAIGSAVDERLSSHSDLRAIIAADEEVDYEHVVDVIDTLKSNGLDAFALEIERETETNP